MESEKEVPQVSEVSMVKPNYMLMSLQRIIVIFVILAAVLVVVHYTPMPGNTLLFYGKDNIQQRPKGINN